jgi:hypothetical protein
MAIQISGITVIDDSRQLVNISGLDAVSQANVASSVVADIRAENHTILVKDSSGTTLKTFYCIPPA